MLPFLVYFATGVVTGYHIYTLLALVVYGVPINPLAVIGLFGSLGLLIAAYISLFRPQAAAKVALIAALAIWSFYGPAIANVVRTRLESEGYHPRYHSRSCFHPHVAEAFHTSAVWSPGLQSDHLF